MMLFNSILHSKIRLTHQLYHFKFLKIKKIWVSQFLKIELNNVIFWVSFEVKAKVEFSFMKTAHLESNSCASDFDPG